MVFELGIFLYPKVLRLILFLHCIIFGSSSRPYDGLLALALYFTFSGWVACIVRTSCIWTAEGALSLGSICWYRRIDFAVTVGFEIEENPISIRPRYLP
jgi:hypothetical protein